MKQKVLQLLATFLSFLVFFLGVFFVRPIEIQLENSTFEKSENTSFFLDSLVEYSYALDGTLLKKISFDGYKQEFYSIITKTGLIFMPFAGEKLLNLVPLGGSILAVLSASNGASFIKRSARRSLSSVYLLLGLSSLCVVFYNQKKRKSFLSVLARAREYATHLRSLDYSEKYETPFIWTFRIFYYKRRKMFYSFI